MISYEEALQIILSDNCSSSQTESVSLPQSLGRYVAKTQSACINVPGYDNSAMDGYAVRAEELAALEQGASFCVSQRIAAGSIASPLKKGTVARIFTGAMLPEGANAVVLQEDTVVDENEKVSFTEQAIKGRHIRLAGQDIRKDEPVVARGQRLNPADIGLLASVGVGALDCYRPQRVAFFSTGDELKDPGEELEPGQIYNSNRYFLESSLRELGLEPMDLGRCPDSAEATASMLLRASELADCIVTTGGMSVGEEDYVLAQAKSVGSIKFWKIAIKPGKPVAFGDIKGVPFFGLPGNPVSSYVTFQLFVRPWLLRAMGAKNWNHQRIVAVSNFDFYNRGKRLDFLRGTANVQSNGQLRVSLFSNQSSGVLSSIAKSNVLIPIKAGCGLRAGESCEVIVLSALGSDLTTV